MSIVGIAKSIEAWNISTTIRNGDWYFPSLETGHILALTVVFCTIVLVDLRLLGAWSKGTKVSKLTSELLPWTWGAWWVAAIFGSILFLSHAAGYVQNQDFILKFVCMGLAGINMFVFHYGAFRDVEKWGAGDPVPAAAKFAGGVSLVLWFGVVLFGRLIGFSGI